MSQSSQSKYIPPHLRPPPNLSPTENTIFASCPTFKELLKVKQEYGADPLVEDFFQAKRLRSAEAGPDDDLGIDFRDQFFKAMGDIMETVQTLGLDVPPGDASLGVKRFLDLGCAPGGFSKWMMERNRDAEGLGITLAPKDHGLGVSTHDWDPSLRTQYHILQRDLTSSIPEIVGMSGEGQLDLVIAGAMYRDENTAQTTSSTPSEGGSPETSSPPVPPSLRNLLTLSQLIIILHTLRPGGSLIMVSSLKPFPITLALLFLLRNLFEDITPTKGKKLHRDRSSYYLVCRRFKGNEVDPGLLDRLESVVEELRAESSLDAANEPNWRALLLREEIGESERELAGPDLDFVLQHFTPMWQNQVDNIKRRHSNCKRNSSHGGRSKKRW